MQKGTMVLATAGCHGHHDYCHEGHLFKVMLQEVIIVGSLSMLREKRMLCRKLSWARFQLL